MSKGGMNPDMRACVAYVAARVISGTKPSGIHDYSRSKHVSVDGTISGKNVDVYDYGRSAHFGGTLPGLYDYGLSAHVELNISGKSFEGYDYGSSSHFSGEVDDSSSVSLYDYGAGKYFNYSI